ncbi:MAG: magnesium transporter [Gammaproteobacteria bacterium]|nr:magnesium transporter [Gammaproteobacteria bacterium]
MNTLETDHSEQILQHIRHEIEKGRLVEMLSQQQTSVHQAVVQQLTHRQQQSQLEKILSVLHPADVARVMESMSPEDRKLVWEAELLTRGGIILLELSDSVAKQIIKSTDEDALRQLLQQLDVDEIGYLVDLLPQSVLHDRLQELSGEDKVWLSQALQFENDSVGAMMDQDMILIQQDALIEQVLKQLRQYKDLPPQSDKLFVTDRKGSLVGILHWHSLVVNEPEQRVSEVMSQIYVSFHPEDSAAHAARAFERYNLVSSPVVNSRGRPIGRLTVDEMMDFMRDDISEDALNSAGLQGEEDLFASVWNSARNRWLWLSLSLLTAFVASRVIGLFEETIASFVALAALMPIVAAIGGNTGNQTTTLVVRGLALAQINDVNRSQLISKEMKLSVLNGLVWGSAVGLFAFIFYGNFTLTLIIAAAMILTLLLAAILGLAIPLTLQSLKRDPALGSGVLVTALTDSMGFFIFLGLAALFL